MSTDIYNFDYEKEPQKKSDNFVPMGSINPQTNIRTSPIVVPDELTMSNIRTSPIGVPVSAAAVKIAKPKPTNPLVKRAERSTTTTARKEIVQKMPTIFKQNPYDYELNRPFSPIQVPTSTTKSDADDYLNTYDEDFHGGKKRTRKARSMRRKRTRKMRSRSTRSKRTKRSSSRRRRGRKSR
jgi:hypothetical protein